MSTHRCVDMGSFFCDDATLLFQLRISEERDRIVSYPFEWRSLLPTFAAFVLIELDVMVAMVRHCLAVLMVIMHFILSQERLLEGGALKVVSQVKGIPCCGSWLAWAQTRGMYRGSWSVQYWRYVASSDFLSLAAVRSRYSCTSYVRVALSNISHWECICSIAMTDQALTDDPIS